MTNPLLARFIPEARDLIQASATGLLVLEKSPNDKQSINEVFRAVHTLKGGSGLFEVAALTNLVHAAEDLLDAVRSARMEIDSALVDCLLDSLDQVTAWIDHLEQFETLPNGADAVSKELVGALRKRSAGRHPDADADQQPQGDDRAGWSAEDLHRIAMIPESDRLQAYSIIRSGNQVHAVRYEPQEQCFYSGEDPFNLVRQAQGLIAVRLVPRLRLDGLADLDPFCCNLTFDLLAAASDDDLMHHFRYVPDQVTVREVGPNEIAVLVGEDRDDPVHHDFLVEAGRLLDAKDYAGLRTAAQALAGLVSPSLRVASALRWIDAALAGDAPDDATIACVIGTVSNRLDSKSDGAGGAPAGSGLRVLPDSVGGQPKAAGNSLVIRIISAQLQLLASPGAMEARLKSAACVLDNVFAQQGLDSERARLETVLQDALAQGAPELLRAFIEDVLSGLAPSEGPLAIPVHDPEPASAETNKATATASSREDQAGARAPSKVLKVDQAKVDELMNLVGELVVSKNSLPFLARRAEEVYGSRDMSREIKEKYAVVDRVVQAMQNAIMEVRMLPVSEVFDRFPRLVRDISRKLGKSVVLTIEGEDTAADKTIIEAIGDPLLHIVRNSLDHGIEPLDERIAASKPAEARLKLRAFHDGDLVCIEIVDDGRGIDPVKIRAAAIAKGVIDEAQAEKLADKDAINLIFHPGFSTAQQVSDLSGRGVGMDVVLTGVQRLGGAVTVDSEVGKGTTVRLSLPLTMAVTRIMTVDCGGCLFGVPMDVVVETVRIPLSRIQTIKSAETFVLRDMIVPLVRVSAMLNLHNERAEHEEEAVLVCRFNGNVVGLVVDNFREGMDVILKPLNGILTNVRGFSGTALLGDGRVLLVLNLKELI
jgi:two-component system, chemotaxis family, sensor kinase CheA